MIVQGMISYFVFCVIFCSIWSKYVQVCFRIIFFAIFRSLLKSLSFLIVACPMLKLITHSRTKMNSRNLFLPISLLKESIRRVAGNIVNFLIYHLSDFYRNFCGHCSQEIREIIPVPLRRVRTTRSSTHSHPFQISLPNPRTLSRKSSFIPRTCNLWNFLPSSCFPESYNLPSFKFKINKLDLISLSS